MAGLMRPRRLRLAVVGAFVAVLIAASLGVALTFEAQHRRETFDAARVQARVLAQTVPAALSFGDAASLKAYVEAARSNPTVAAVGVYDDRGRLVAQAGETPPPRLPRTSRGVGPGPGVPEVIEPVSEKAVPLGAVYLRYRPESVERRLSRYIGPGILVLMGSLMFFIMGLDARALLRANESLTREMAERERVEAALRQSQKMEAIGRLTGGIAHDFNNMLSIIIGSLDLLLRRVDRADPRLSRLAEGALEGARRAANLTQRLLAFSRRQPLNPTAADIPRVLAETADLLRRTLGEAITLETVSAAGLWRALIDVPQLESAIVNLAINARDAMPDGGRLTVEASNSYLDRLYADQEGDIEPGQYVMIAVTDTGVGMTPEIMAQVFEPFFTTKPTGQGTGLGLSQVQGFIKQSGGHVRLYSEVGVGTTVKLYLPRAAEEAPAQPARLLRSSAPKRREVTILVVEDEPGVRDFVVEALGDLGYDVLSAERAAEALELIDRHPEIRLVLTDVVMPGVTGRVLADEALRRRPGLQILFMTGYTPNAIVHNGVLDPGVRLITKPFSVSDLESELDALVGAGLTGRT
jgi:signal transduction histidine kinase